MAILTKDLSTAEFLLTEANGCRSRDAKTVVAGGATLLPGTLLGQITSNGNFAPYDPSNSNGTETVAGILYEGTTGTTEKTVITRDAEVRQASLTYHSGATANEITTANGELEALGILAR